MEEKSRTVPISPSLKATTDDVRSDLTAYNVVGILTYLLIFAFIVGVCAWRALFLPADIWTLWTPWWLLVGIFLGLSYVLFLDFLLIRLRSHQITFLWVVAVVILVLLIGGGAVFWIWELVVYCYGNHDYFCYVAGSVPWNVWLAFGTYWGMVLFLIIQSVIVGNALRSEKRRQRLSPTFVNTREIELEGQISERTYLTPGAGSMAQAMIYEATQRKFK
jgi:hypothetical protein